MTLYTKTLVMIVVVVLLVLAVALSVLLVPSTSWAGALEWFMTLHRLVDVFTANKPFRSGLFTEGVEGEVLRRTSHTPLTGVRCTRYVGTGPTRSSGRDRDTVVGPDKARR